MNIRRLAGPSERLVASVCREFCPVTAPDISPDLHFEAEGRGFESRLPLSEKPC